MAGATHPFDQEDDVGGLRVPSARARWVRAVALLSVPLAAALITGCGAGQITQSSEQRSGVDGAQSQVGDIALRNVAVLPPTGNSYEKGATIALDGVIVNTGIDNDQLVSVTYGELTATVVTADDAAAGAASSESASAASASAASASVAAPNATDASQSGTEPSAGTASAPASNSAAVTTAAPTTSAASTDSAASSLPLELPAQTDVQIPAEATITFTGIPEALYPTQTIKLTFTFAKAGAVTFQIPVGVPLNYLGPASSVYNYKNQEEGGG